MKVFNHRQDVILLNALSYINDIVNQGPDSPTSYAKSQAHIPGIDKGLHCTLSDEKIEQSGYLKLLNENIDTGLLGQIKLDSRQYAHNLHKLRYELGAKH